MNVLVVFATLILLAFVFVKPVTQGSAACRSVLGRLLPHKVPPGVRFRIPYLWDIHAYPMCWFFSRTTEMSAGRAAPEPSLALVNWWIADAFVFGQLHVRGMEEASEYVGQPENAAALGLTPEFNVLKYIGHWAIAAELDQLLRRQPDALQISINLPPRIALRGGSGDAYDGANGKLIQIINPLLLQHCGVIIDKLHLKQDE